MKVNKHGNLIKKRMHKFKCNNCGCKYTANTGEWKYCSEYGNPSDKPTDYVSCDCPECGKSTRIQWRGNVRDWWKEYRTLVFALIALLALISLFTFGTLNNVKGAAISAMIFVVSLTITYFSSEM